MYIKIVYALVAAILVISVCGITGYNYGYVITPCEAIDISLTDVRVIDFLDRTNMATASVHNCKNYQGYNTWLVNWHTKTQFQKVYVDIYTGEIVGTGPAPGPCWHTVETLRGRNAKDTVVSVKSDMWRMNWKTTGIESDSSLSVGIYETTGLMMEVDRFLRGTFPFNSGTYSVYEGPGSYVITVCPTNLESWELEIEDFF
jgi:hypothetical protein